MTLLKVFCPKIEQNKMLSCWRIVEYREGPDQP